MVLPFDVAAKIYNGDITTWNDQRIQNANPGVSLPNQAIQVVTGSDTQGGASYSIRKAFAATYSSWTAVNPNDAWPRSNAVASNPLGMISTVQNTAYSIGYSSYDMAVATGVAFAAIKNQQGNVVLPSSPKALSEAIAVAQVSVSSQSVQLSGLMNVNSPNAYPYLTVYYSIVQAAAQDRCRQRREALRFLFWSMSDLSSAQIMRTAGYEPLPAKIYSQALTLAQSVTCSGTALYAASPCDNGCSGGFCQVKGTVFNPPEDQCFCDSIYLPGPNGDCSIIKNVQSPAQTPLSTSGIAFNIPVAGSEEVRMLYQQQLAPYYSVRESRGTQTASVTFVSSTSL